MRNVLSKASDINYVTTWHDFNYGGKGQFPAAGWRCRTRCTMVPPSGQGDPRRTYVGWPHISQAGGDVLFRLGMETPLLWLQHTGSLLSRRGRAVSLMVSCPPRCYPSPFKLSSQTCSLWAPLPFKSPIVLCPTPQRSSDPTETWLGSEGKAYSSYPCLGKSGPPACSGLADSG